MLGGKNFHPRRGCDGSEGEQRYSCTLSSVLDGDGWSMPRPGRFTSGKCLVLLGLLIV